MLGVVTGLEIGTGGYSGFVEGTVTGVVEGTVNGGTPGLFGVIVTGLVVGTVTMVGGLFGGGMTGVVDIGVVGKVVVGGNVSCKVVLRLVLLRSSLR